MSAAAGEGTFERWSRRKRAASRPAPPEREAAPAPAAPLETPAPDAAEPEPSEAEWLARHDLPDPETLGLGDDFTAFLRRSAPKSLRRRALRRLWRSDPRLACLDGLVDYNDDYTDAATVPPLLKTAWRVGEGFARAAEKAAKAAEAVAGDDAPAPLPAASALASSSPAVTVAETEATPRSDAPAGPAAEPAARPAGEAAAPPVGPAVRPRPATKGGRMRFTAPEARPASASVAAPEGPQSAGGGRG